MLYMLWHIELGVTTLVQATLSGCAIVFKKFGSFSLLDVACFKHGIRRSTTKCRWVRMLPEESRAVTLCCRLSHCVSKSWLHFLGRETRSQLPSGPTATPGECFRRFMEEFNNPSAAECRWTVGVRRVWTVWRQFDVSRWRARRFISDLQPPSSWRQRCQDAAVLGVGIRHVTIWFDYRHRGGSWFQYRCLLLAVYKRIVFCLQNFGVQSLVDRIVLINTKFSTYIQS